MDKVFELLRLFREKTGGSITIIINTTFGFARFKTPTAKGRKIFFYSEEELLKILHWALNDAQVHEFYKYNQGKRWEPTL
jgi:hypothetical protein